MYLQKFGLNLASLFIWHFHCTQVGEEPQEAVLLYEKIGKNQYDFYHTEVPAGTYGKLYDR